MATILRAHLAKESYCIEQKKIAAAAIEQLDSIKKVVEERDTLRKKLECSQEELEKLRKNIAQRNNFALQTPSRGDAETATCNLPSKQQKNSTDNDIKQLELDIEQMRRQDITPEIEAKVIRKEVEVLKKYCSKLSVIQKENYELKAQISLYEDTFAGLGYSQGIPNDIEELKYRVEAVNDTKRERDGLREKVKKLEKELCSYKYLPEDVEVFKQRSLLLDEVLADRARLSQRVEQLRGLDQEVIVLKKKAARVDELEDNLMRLNREKSSLEDEIDQLKCKFSTVEIEGYNKQAEGDTLRSKMICMEHEMATLRCFCEDKERLRLERDHLKNSLDELIRMQGDFDNVKKHMKCMEVLKAERDMFKSKYENLIGLECECDILRTQVERAKSIEKERDSLENQVEDLEVCIAEQESEIRRLVCHIDLLAKGRDEEQEKFKELLVQMRTEVDKKESLIASTEEKLSLVQSELKNSIHGLSSETLKYKNKTEKLESVTSALHLEMNSLKSRNAELESSLNIAHVENQKMIQHIMGLKKENDNLSKHLKDLTEDNVFLIQRLEEKEDSLNTLREVLKDHEPILDEFEKYQILRIESSRDTQTETNPICLITTELEMAKEENRRLHEKVTKISNLAGDHQLQELLHHSKSAIRRISLELNKQCNEWHSLQNQLKVFGSDDEQEHVMRAPENFIVNYCISTGINTDVEKWDCIKARRRGQATQITESTNTNITISRNDVEVESSSFIIQGGSSMPSTSKSSTPKLEAGTITKGLDVVSKAVDSPSASKLEDVQSERRTCTCAKKFVRSAFSEENLKKKKEHAVTQKPEKVIYATKTKAKSEGVQWEYNISRWNCMKKHSMPQTSISRSVTSLDDVKQHLSTASNTKQIIYSHITTEESILCNAACNKTTKTTTATQENIVIVSTKPAVCNAECQKTGQTSIAVQLKEEVKSEKCNAACQKSPQVTTATTKTDTVIAKDEEVETFETARSSPCKHCRNLEERIQILEKELTSANEMILKLQDEACVGARAVAENEALRRHSTEVQEVAKDQIEDLIEHVKMVQVKATTLEDENESLNKCNCSLQLEVRQLSKLIQELQKQNNELIARNAALEKELKDDSEISKLRDELNKALGDNADMEKLLANDMVSRTKRNTLLQNELGSLTDQNKDLKNEIDRLKANYGDLEKNLANALEENKRLMGELNKTKQDLKQLRETTADLSELNALRNENENLLRKIKAQTLETNELLAKLKTPHVDIPPLPVDMKDKGVLTTVCQDLESQLRGLEKARDIPTEATEDLHKILAELCKRLEDAEQRAKKAEELLSTMKVSDPTAMLNDDLNKCRAKLAQVELENESLRKGKEEMDRIKAELVSSKGDYEKRLKEMQELIDKLKADNGKLIAAASETPGDSNLRDEINKLKQQIGQLESENTGLKNKVAEQRRSFDKIDQLQQAIGQTKQDLLKAENEIERLKKELENSLNSRKDDGDKVDKMEKERTKNLTTIQNLESEIARLKKELELSLSAAKDSSLGTSDLQKEIANLKLKLDQLEGDNSKLNKELGNALASLKLTSEKLEQKIKENETLVQQNAANAEQMQKLKSQLDKANIDAQSAVNANKELESLKDQINKLQAQNAKLQSASKAEGKVEELEDLVAKLRQQIAGLEGEKSKLQKDFEKSKNELESALAKGKVPAVPTEQLGKLEAENARLNKELNTALDNFAKVNATILQNQEEIKNLKQKIALLESENGQLKKQIIDIQDGSKASTAELAKLKSGESALKQRLAVLESENLKLKKDLDVMAADVKNYLAQIENLKQTNSKQQKENERLAQSLEAAIKDITPKDESAIWKQKALQTEEALNKLKKDLESVMDDHRKCPNTISQLGEENGRLKSKLTDLENQMNKLKNQYEGAMGDSLKNVSALEKLKGSEDKLKGVVSKLEMENSKLQNDLTVLNLELGKMDSLLNKTKEEAVSLKQKNASLESTVIKLKSDLDSALSEKDKLQKTLNQLMNESSKQKERIAQLEAENAKLKKELDNLAASAKKEVPAFDDAKLKEKLAQLESENNKLKTELNSVLDEAKQTANAKDKELKSKQQLANLENEHSKLKKDLEKALKDAEAGSNLISQLKDENAKLKQKINQLENEMSGLKKDLDSALDQTKKEVSGKGAAQDDDNKLKQRLAQLEKDREQLKKDLEQALKDASAKSDITADLRNENSKQKQLVAQLQAEILKLQSKLDAQEKLAKKAAADDEMEDLRKKLKQLEKENTSLKTNLDGAYGDAKSAADSNSKLVDENSKLKKKLQELQNEIDGLKKELSECDKEKKALTGNIAKLKEHEASLNKQLSEQEATNARLKQALDASGAGKRRSEENIALKQSLSKAENELKRLKNGIDDAMNDVKKKSNEIQKLKDDISKLKVKLAELEKTNAKLKSDLDSCIFQNGKLKKDQGDNLASMKDLKDQHDKDVKNLMKKNEENIASLKKQHQSMIDDLNNKHDKELKALQDALKKSKEALAEITSERDKLKKLLEEQKRKSLDIKDKVEQVEDVIMKERRKSKEEKQKSKVLSEKMDAQARKMDMLKRKSEELELSNQELIDKASKAEKERDSLEKSSLVLKESFEREIRKSVDMQKDMDVLKNMIACKKDKLKAETFKTVSLDGRMPDVIAITTPLSEKELKFFGKKICTCEPNLQTIINKMATQGIQSLTIEELQFLHYKLCDATADQLAKMGQSAGVLKPNENDKLGLLRRIASLEGDLLKKQKHAQQKVIAMQYAVKLEKERLYDLKMNLEEEKKKNGELLSQIDSHSKIVENIREERDSIQRQKTYHEQKLEQYIVTIEEERAKTRNLEDELDKEKTNVLHLKSLLETERDRARLNKRKDTEALERMRIKLEKTVNSEMVLKMKLQDRWKQRSHSPACTPVKDTNHPVRSKSKVTFCGAPSLSESRNLKSSSAKRLASGCSQISSSRLDYSEK